MKIHPDAWLSDLFGYPAFKVTVFDTDEPDRATAADRKKQIADLAGGGCAFLYAKVGTTRVSRTNEMAGAGFRVVDVNTTFERKPDRAARALLPSSVEVRDIRPEEHDAVLAIAEHCFVYSRFHLDPCVPRDLANRIKRSWIESYIANRRGERLLVAVKDGRPAGFLAVLSAAVDGKTASVIDLVGVGKPYQGAGVGKRLVEFFVDDSSGKCDTLRVGTQIANIPSMRLYERCGFQMCETAYVLHAHVRDGEIVV